MGAGPYVEELVRRLRLDDAALQVHHGGRQSVAISFAPPGLAHRVTVWTREPDLAAAVTALAVDAEQLWPGTPPAAAGFNLLLVHLDEVVATRDTTDPLRITADGLQWPRDLRAQ